MTRQEITKRSKPSKSPTRPTPPTETRNHTNRISNTAREQPTAPSKTHEGATTRKKEKTPVLNLKQLPTSQFVDLSTSHLTKEDAELLRTSFDKYPTGHLGRS